MNPEKRGGGRRKRQAMKKLNHLGLDIELVEPADDPAVDPMLSIDGTEVMVRREEIGGYSAPMLNMHGVYPSVEALAKNLVEISPVFVARRATTEK